MIQICIWNELMMENRVGGGKRVFLFVNFNPVVESYFFVFDSYAGGNCIVACCIMYMDEIENDLKFQCNKNFNIYRKTIINLLSLFYHLHLPYFRVKIFLKYFYILEFTDVPRPSISNFYPFFVVFDINTIFISGRTDASWIVGILEHVLFLGRSFVSFFLFFSETFILFIVCPFLLLCLFICLFWFCFVNLLNIR